MAYTIGNPRWIRVDILKLNGLNGIVYLMFLGRETYARDLAQKLVRLEFIKNEDTIYSVIKKLKKAGFLKDIKKLEKKPGVPILRTSTFIPFFSLLKVVKPIIQREDLERIMEYVQGISEGIHFFPEYIQMTYTISEYDIQKLRWPILTATYLNFILGLLIFINPAEKFEAKAYSKITSEIFDKDVQEKHFNPIRKARGKISKDLYDDISNRHYEDDMLLLAELSNRILYGPKYEFIKNTIGFTARNKLASHKKK